MNTTTIYLLTECEPSFLCELCAIKTSKKKIAK